MRSYTSRATGECSVQLINGAFCSAPPRAGLPFPICTRHAVQLHAAMQEETRRLMAEQGYMHGALRNADEEDRQRRDLLMAQSVVYYIDMPGDVVKIGTTTNLKARLTSLRVDADKVLATEPGDARLEKRRHTQFKAHRVGKREDFRPSPTLMAWIDKVRRDHGAPTITTYVKVPA